VGGKEKLWLCRGGGGGGGGWGVGNTAMVVWVALLDCLACACAKGKDARPPHLRGARQGDDGGRVGGRGLGVNPAVRYGDTVRYRGIQQIYRYS